MAVGAKNYTSTRLYYANGNTVKKAAPAPSRSPGVKPQPNKRPQTTVTQPGTQVSLKPRPLTAAQIKRRIAGVTALTLISLALMVVVFNYSNISRAYSQLNELSKNVEITQKNINDLKLQIEQSTDIESIMGKAKAAGFGSPDGRNMPGLTP